MMEESLRKKQDETKSFIDVHTFVRQLQTTKEAGQMENPRGKLNHQIKTCKTEMCVQEQKLFGEKMLGYDGRVRRMWTICFGNTRM